jgi:hypothetical protein
MDEGVIDLATMEIVARACLITLNLTNILPYHDRVAARLGIAQEALDSATQAPIRLREILARKGLPVI